MNVDTGQFQAISARVGALEAGVAVLREQVGHAIEFGEMLARARYPEALLAAAGAHARPGGPRHARDRHGLRAITGGKR